MASVQKKPVPRICNQKHVSHQSSRSKSRSFTRRMGERTHEVRAVAAWVEPEPPIRVNRAFNEMTEAVVSAQYEEQRLKKQHQEKNDRLQRFQDQVKFRVKILEQVKKRQQLEKSYRAVELERNIVQQSAFAAEKATSRRDRCSILNQGPMIIHTSSNNNNRCHSYDLRNTPARRIVGLEQHTNQVHKFMNEARKNLMSKKVIGENYQADVLPGGRWKESSTRERSVQRNTTERNGVELDDQDPAPELITTDGADAEQASKHAAFKDQDHSSKRRKGGVLGDIQVNVPDIYPGVVGEEMKKQTVTQRAMFRRLFMDIEREQVKEVTRKKEHRKRIALLKKEKEDNREREEARAKYMIEPRDVATGETQYEMVKRERQEESTVDEQRKRSSDRARKTKETERFVDALRHNLRERIKKRNLQVPPMCSCGETVWDTNPDTCANNCVFYKNPKVYAKALQSLLSSFDL
ncbi:coiled-coil domain-containing protein 15-like [Lineus longissimus]|uniref:coiled-coil domain-containing protein 15-like n=1 Tax=Lineus longissimus TaxID=88925 RepID=UPI002B4C5B94